MEFFKHIRRKKNDVTKPINSESELVQYEYISPDYLGKAADAGRKAKDAIKERKYDEAWKLYHQQKELYWKFASQYGHSPTQLLALDATVHEDLANILRLESKHTEAFVNILYWVMNDGGRRTKRQTTKLRAYFNRCKFKNLTLKEVEDYIGVNSYGTELTDARAIVMDWLSKE
jgi:HSP90 family molecular chaperone